MITTPTDAEVEAGALALWKDEQCKWVSPDYSQHQGALRNYAKVVLTAARAVEPNPNELPLEMIPEGCFVESIGQTHTPTYDLEWTCTIELGSEAFDGYGPTPRAAFEAACAAAGEKG